METSRRSFLKAGGLCTLGLASLPAADALAQAALPKVMANPTALVGKKWGMVIDMKKCWEKGKEGCKDCVNACHVTHNVPDIGNVKEEIKWIWQDEYEHAFPGQATHYNEEFIHGKKFILLCNHCTNPPCVRVCPTKATFKRKEDGIVMMDFHRCIGCRFCMAGCPYASRSFNFKEPRPFIKTELNQTFPTRERGVVEKCSFCEERLAKGQIPACVEACKPGALVFGDLEDPKSEVRKLLASHYTIQRKLELGTGPNIFYIV